MKRPRQFRKKERRRGLYARHRHAFSGREDSRPTLEERFAALWEQHDRREASDGGILGRTLAKELAFWRDFSAALRGFLSSIRPAARALFWSRPSTPAADTGPSSADYGSRQTIDFDLFDEIVTKNLFGVDLNAESVEITVGAVAENRAPDHQLQNLEATIKVGNSLIDDPAFTDALRLARRVPEVFAQGGFDVVIGNPPYVRMELLKSVKPYLESTTGRRGSRRPLRLFLRARHRPAEGRRAARLYLVLDFFRTGSGENLRALSRRRRRRRSRRRFRRPADFRGCNHLSGDCDAQQRRRQAGEVR